MTTEKTCIKCHQTKPVSSFYTTSKAGTKHMNTCIPCYLSQKRTYYKQHPEKFTSIETRNKKQDTSFITHYEPPHPYSRKKSLTTVLNDYLNYLNETE
jgi:hypothetical protein